MRQLAAGLPVLFQRKPHPSSPGGFAAATLLSVGLTSTVAQFGAAASPGIAAHFEWGLSTGGLIALVGSIYMGAKCPNWEFWKKWIWLWVGITVILAFVSMNLVSRTFTN